MQDNTLSHCAHGTGRELSNNIILIQPYSGTYEIYYFQQFLAVCHTCALKRLSLPPIQQAHTFMEEVCSLMPHWTPCKQDNIVYVTITEAMSGDKADRESYLTKVKRDLCVGQPGYPSQITIAGDQQTYTYIYIA